jgi:hypothetical protein
VIIADIRVICRLRVVADASDMTAETTTAVVTRARYLTVFNVVVVITVARTWDYRVCGNCIA